MTQEFETACFGIITYVGTARSCFINAVQFAKKGDFEGAEDRSGRETKPTPRGIISMQIF